MENKEPVFQKEISLLGQVKAGIYKTFEEKGVQVTPTIAESVRNATLFLDTAYLWLSQLGFFVQAGGTGEVPATDGEDGPVEISFPTPAADGGSN